MKGSRRMGKMYVNMAAMKSRQHREKMTSE